MSRATRRMMRSKPPSNIGNLLLHKLFSCTLSAQSGYPLSNLTDGNSATKWVSIPNDIAVLTADLGAVHELSSIKLLWDGTTTKNYEIAISIDASIWTFLTHTTTANQAAEAVTITTFSDKAIGRYLRITCIDRWSVGAGNTLWEARAYGTALAAYTSAPQNLTATPASTSVALSWAAPATLAGTLLGYHVFLNGVVQNGSMLTGTNFTVTGLSASTHYSFSVRAYSSTGAVVEGPGAWVTTQTSAAATRDKYAQPFASTSIWNRPIGSSAVLASLTSLAAAKGGTWRAPSQGHSVDESYIAMDPSGSARRLIDRGYWWPYPQSGFTAVDSGVQVLVADTYLIPAPASGNTPNNMAAMIKAGTGGSSAVEFQYACRPTAATDITYFEQLRGTWDLLGDGLSDGFGSHGGSGLNCLGGTIRGGELVGNTPITHALSMTINTKKWACQNGGGIANGYRWPAQAADSDAMNATHGYGRNTTTGNTPLSSPGVALDGLGMGTLLALPSNLDIATLGLETTYGAKIADAMQGYGAYVVDTSEDTGSWDVWLWNLDKVANTVDLPALSESYAGGSPGMNTALVRDLNKILLRLCIVTNNAAGGTCAGGGTPTRPLAPPVA